MAKKIIPSIMFCLLLGSLGIAQNTPQQKAKSLEPPSSTSDLVDGMARRLSHDLNVRTVIGEPIKVGAVTLIPILMLDVNFGDGATKVPSRATASQSAESQANLFYMSGEARPLGVVAISGKGTRFINLVRPNAK